MGPARDPRLLVVAIGGSAIREPATAAKGADWLGGLERVLPPLVELAAVGFRLVLTHPAGPPAGDEALALDLRTAGTQGTGGYAVQQAFGRLCRARKLDVPAVALVTRVAVDPADPAFQAPAAPIGPPYPPARVRLLQRRRGWTFARAGRTWRRVVPAPRPVAVLEAETVRRLSLTGAVIIACGGGGVPVVPTEEGYRGVEALVEQDLSTGLLASAVGAERVVFLTAVGQAAVRYGTRQEIAIERLTLAEARTLLGAGEFPPGSMGPKIEAGVRFVEAGGREAIITSRDRVRAALDGEAGTRVVPG
jgi:carbamate kinase